MLYGLDCQERVAGILVDLPPNLELG